MLTFTYGIVEMERFCQKSVSLGARAMSFSQFCFNAYSSLDSLTVVFFSFSLSVSSRERCPQASGLESLAAMVSSVEETPDPIPATIKGTIPIWINGSFLRNGPGKFEFGEGRYLMNTINLIFSTQVHSFNSNVLCLLLHMKIQVFPLNELRVIMLRLC